MQPEQGVFRCPNVTHDMMFKLYFHNRLKYLWKRLILDVFPSVWDRAQFGLDLLAVTIIFSFVDKQVKHMCGEKKNKQLKLI